MINDMEKVLDKKGLKYLIDKIKSYVKVSIDKIEFESFWEGSSSGELFTKPNIGLVHLRSCQANSFHTDMAHAKMILVESNGSANSGFIQVEKNISAGSITIGYRGSEFTVGASGQVHIQGINGYTGTNPTDNNTLQKMLTLATSDDIESIFND